MNREHPDSGRIVTSGDVINDLHDEIAQLRGTRKVLWNLLGECLPVIDRNLRGKPRGSARGSSEQAGTACGATSVASGQLACEAQQGQPHQPLPTEMLSGE